MRAPLLRLLPLLLAALPAQQGRASTPLPASGELTCERTLLARCDFLDPDSGLHFAWPNDWPARRLALVTVTGPPARSRQADATRWIAIEYLPDDPSQPQTTLVWVAVVPRGDWITQSARPGARRTPGIEVATGPRHVAVAVVPDGNPYPVESRDAEIFDALRPSLAEVSLFVRFSR